MNDAKGVPVIAIYTHISYGYGYLQKLKSDIRPVFIFSASCKVKTSNADNFKYIFVTLILSKKLMKHVDYYSTLYFIQFTDIFYSFTGP